MMSRSASLWMGDLEPYMDENFLKQSFSLMGETIRSAKIIKHKLTGAFMGYCFVEFDTEETALMALHRLNGKTIPHSNPPKRFKLNHVGHGKDHLYVREFSLFVGDLTLEVDDLALFRAFSSRYPSVRAAKVVLDPTGRSKGFGFVRFTDEYEQQSALSQMQGFIGLGSKPLRVSLATQKRPPPNSVSAQDYSRYYQGYEQYASYDQYQNYYSQWQDYSQYYNYNSNYYYGYGYDQQSSVAATAGTQDTQLTYDTSMYDYADISIEEHDIPLDLDQINQEAMDKNDELYGSLEEARWMPMEVLKITISDPK